MRLISCLAGSALLVSAAIACAQEYPAKPIGLITPFPPGGSADVIARLVGSRITAAWGKPVIVDSRPGAGGVVASEALAKAAPDGYTLMLGTANVSINPSLYRSLPFDTHTAFAPIVQAISVPNVFVVRSSLRAQNLKEFIALAKSEPGKLNYGGAGNGTFPHLIVELFKDHVGVNVVNIPFKGNAPAMLAILRNDIDLLSSNVSDVLPHLKSGKLRALAVTSATRIAILPDVPTFAEAGVPGFEGIGWMGFFAPAKTPGAIVSKLNAKIREILRTSEMSELLAKEGFDVIANSPGEFAAFLKKDVARWALAVKLSGVTPE